MHDRLSLINSALIRTGNNPCGTEDDGSDEWLVGAQVYDDELPFVLHQHDWGFAAEIRTLVRSGDSPDPDFTDAYARPVDALHVENVLISSDWNTGLSIPYRILGRSILVNAPVTPPLAKIIVMPATLGDYPEGFINALRWRLMAGIYRGINEDLSAADDADKTAAQFLAVARARADQESPPKALLVSRLRQARYIRRGGLNWPDRSY